MGVGEARAKLLLFGEHAAVYGHPAVGCSLNWGLKANLDAGGPWALPGLGPHEPVVRTLLERLTALAASEGLAAPTPGRLAITTTIPVGAGFGSSGALCAGLVNLFWPDLALGDRDRLAWKAEGLFHGTPSGIDTALALRQGWWHLDASTRPVTATPLVDPGLVLVVGSVARESDTKSLVGALGRRRAEGDQLVRHTLDDLGSIASRAVSAVQEHRSADLPLLVSQAREGLRALGLETPNLTTVLDTGLALPGALAGKLSGAGGGGAFFLVFQNREFAREALPFLRASIAETLWTASPEVV